ncbi:hypothetical protein M758_1G121900 [Ceratodon purpureus]|nr:hypothetical protein M758_1G121900 [Ceratodon purpureus]
MLSTVILDVLTLVVHFCQTISCVSNRTNLQVEPESQGTVAPKDHTGHHRRELCTKPARLLPFSHLFYHFHYFLSSPNNRILLQSDCFHFDLPLTLLD